MNFSDTLFGLMVIPNLLAVLLLSRPILAATRKYFKQLEAGEFAPDRVAARHAALHKGEDI